MHVSKMVVTAALTAAAMMLPTRAPGDEPTSAPATQASGAESLRVFVVEVKGLVQVRATPDAAWTPAKAGMEVGEGAEFRTGPRSSVTCQIPPDQTLTLDRLGTVKIAEAIRSGNKLKTDLIMKYGRTHYDIEAAGMEHESTIRSPSSTLAVRGTSVSLYDQPPFTPEALSYHGTATFRNAHRTLRFGAKTLTKVANDQNSAADTALSSQTVDPTSASARSAADARFVALQSSTSATVFFDRTTQIETIENGPPPLSDAQLNADAAAGKLPGNLDIVIRWTGNADLNLEVGEVTGTNPNKLLVGIQTGLNEFLYPGFGLNHSASGGTIPFDNRGGPNGGTELAYWNTPPQGLYGISAIHMSGAPALVSFNVFLDGKPLDNLTTLQVDSTGNLVLGSDGNPTFALVKSSQINRPLSTPSVPPPASGFGPGSGAASVQAFIPSIPSADGPVPVEPPVTFPGFPTPASVVNSAKTGTGATATPAKSTPIATVTTAATPMQAALRPQSLGASGRGH
jgi:hypothetical protein